MPRRYYLTPIIGSGTEADPYRVALAHAMRAYSVVIPTDPATGVPVAAWGLAVVDADDHAPFDGDGTLSPVGPYALTTTIASLTTSQRNAIKNALSKFGLPGSLVDNAATIGDLLYAVGSQLPRFREQYSGIPG